MTLQDLRERTQSNYETIGQAVSMRMCGYGAGAIFGNRNTLIPSDFVDPHNVHVEF